MKNRAASAGDSLFLVAIIAAASVAAALMKSFSFMGHSFQVGRCVETRFYAIGMGHLPLEAA